MIVLTLVAGLAALLAGAEVLVRGASRLAQLGGVPPLVIGLTVVAYGTSAPELAVSVGAAFNDQADLAVGNVVGSNIFNVLFILGLSAAIIPLEVARKLVRLDVPLMIAASFALPLLARDGRLGRLEGAVLVLAGIAYTVFAVVEGRREGRADDEAGAPPWSAGGSIVAVAAGLGLLVLGSRWLVTAAVVVARAFGVSELVIGLTLVAAGTSLPEVATSIVAALRGQRDIAVGNVVGSNLFNILFVLGATATLARDGVAVSAAAMRFDIPVMVAVAVACLPIFFTGYRIDRWEGGLFLLYYGVYVTVLVLAARRHAGLPTLERAMLSLVLPLTALTLVVLAWRAWRRGNPGGSEEGSR